MAMVTGITVMDTHTTEAGMVQATIIPATGMAIIAQWPMDMVMDLTGISDLASDGVMVILIITIITIPIRIWFMAIILIAGLTA